MGSGSMANAIKDSFDETPGPVGINEFRRVLDGAKRISVFAMESRSPLKTIERTLKPMPGSRAALVSFSAKDDISSKKAVKLCEKIISYLDPGTEVFWGTKKNPAASGISIFLMVAE